MKGGRGSDEKVRNVNFGRSVLVWGKKRREKWRQGGGRKNSKGERTTWKSS